VTGLAILAALAAVYARALGGPFVFDDQTAVVSNETLRSLSPLRSVLVQPPDLTTSGRPVAALSLALDYAAGGLSPAVFRATNLALHGLVALLLFDVVRRTLRSRRLGAGFAAHANGLAAASALLFAVHPLASEVACYVSARTESLVALCYLAALDCAICARGSARPWAWLAAALAVCALGMASKEVMVSAPLVIALHGAVFDGFDEGRWRLHMGTFYALAPSWLLLGWLLAASPRAGSAGFDHWVTPAVYLANQCRLLPRYLALVVWPHPLRIDYGTPEPLAFGDVWAGALFTAALLAGSLWALWRRPAAGFVGVACFAVLATSSSLFPIASEVGAERRMYLPLAALVPLAVSCVWLALGRLRAERLAPPLVCASALALAAVSFARAGDYETEVGLWRHDVAAAPENRRAHYNLATALEGEGRSEEARAEMAQAVRAEIDFYERVLPRQPDPVTSRVDLGALHELAGEPERARELYDEALLRAPEDGYALRRMALLLVRNPALGVPGDPRAREFAERAVGATSRRDAAALEALAQVELASGNAEAALALLREALATDPARQSARVLDRIRREAEGLASGGESPSP